MLPNLTLSNFKLNSDLIWKLYIFFCVVLIICTSSTEAFADVSSDPFGSSLCQVVKVLSGSIAKAIATAAIFATALGFFSGKLQWQTVAVLSVGIITIFSASSLVGWLSGDSTQSGCAS
jgi:type IV secretory pathway VirB2 component (pilin)